MTTDTRIPTSALPLAAQLLHQLHPATGVVHVGTGQGLGAIHQWRQWGVANALLIDAAADQAPWLSAELSAHAGWQHIAAVIGATEAPQTFYTASNPAESGTLQPEALQSVWPNLRTQQQQSCTTQPLDALADAKQLGWQPDWLLVDCLPALPMLQGAAHLLAYCNVVWVRVTLGSALPETTQLEGVQRFLEQHHFKPIALAEGMNPALGEALFVRDMAKELLANKASPPTQQAQAATETIANQQAEIAQLTTARDQEAKAKAEAISQRDAVAQERDQLFASRYSLASEKQQLIAQRDQESKAKADALAQRETEAKAKTTALAERDAQAQLATERQTALDAALAAAQAAATNAAAEAAACAASSQDAQQKQASAHEQQAQAASKTIADLQAEKAQLAAARDQEAKAKAEALAQRDAEAQAKADALTQRDAEAQAKTTALAERDAHAQAKTDLQQRLQTLEADHHEDTLRQQLLQEELIKAEAQIELIKDLLLREPGL